MFQHTGYQVFEKVRNEKFGGGLMTIVDTDLNPVIVDDFDDVEILNVEAMLPSGTVNLINAYGPQEYDSVHTKIHFWKSLEEEIGRSKACVYQRPVTISKFRSRC